MNSWIVILLGALVLAGVTKYTIPRIARKIRKRRLMPLLLKWTVDEKFSGMAWWSRDAGVKCLFPDGQFEMMEIDDFLKYVKDTKRNPDKPVPLVCWICLPRDLVNPRSFNQLAWLSGDIDYTLDEVKASDWWEKGPMTWSVSVRRTKDGKVKKYRCGRDLAPLADQIMRECVDMSAVAA